MSKQLPSRWPRGQIAHSTDAGFDSLLGAYLHLRACGPASCGTCGLDLAAFTAAMKRIAAEGSGKRWRICA